MDKIGFMVRATILATTLFCATLTSAKVHFITRRNYVEKTYEKTVVLLFYSDDQYSKQFMPDFKALSNEFRNEEEILFGKINCSGTSRSLCTTFDVKGYPSVLYGNPFSLKKLRRDMKLEKTIENAKRDVKPVCWPSKPEYCTEEEKELYDKYMEWSIDDLNAAVKVEEQKIIDAEQFLIDETARMKELFDVERAQRDGLFDNSDYWLARAVKHFKLGAGEETAENEIESEGEDHDEL